MDSLVQDRIYRRVALMDYQGACSDKDSSSIAGTRKLKPDLLSWLLNSVTSLGLAWLSFLPNPTEAWSRVRYGDEFGDAQDEMDGHYSEMDDYEAELDYPIDDIVTAPEIVSCLMFWMGKCIF